MITLIRRFNTTKMMLGVGFDNNSYFVYHKSFKDNKWQKHCGPYSTFNQAQWWINEIRETR